MTWNQERGLKGQEGEFGICLFEFGLLVKLNTQGGGGF